jgi:hypothetical protein
MIRTLRHAPFLAFAALGLALGGCGPLDEQALAEASVTSALQTSRSAGAGKLVLDGALQDGCMTPVDAAAEAAARPSVGLYPSSCVTKVQDGASVHAELSDCTGAFGRVHLNGGVDATFSEGGACDKLHAEIVDSGDLTGNDRPIEYSASAEITVREALRDVAWSGSWSATTKRGEEVAQTSELLITVDTATDCIALGGDTSGYVGDIDVDTTIEGLSVCPEACPSAGTLNVHVDGRRRERSLTVVFDGSSTAKVTGSSGREFEIDMVCNDDEE